ncbi:MAG: DUF1853 family protein [Pseudomonadales bacterium]|nr:DUF1853 family protein [Pseudomonadales bacterium]
MFAIILFSPTILYMPALNRQQRDLAWCLQSPALISNGDHGSFWPNDDWYHGLSLGMTEGLPKPKFPDKFRLGRHFEQLIQFWLHHQPHKNLLAANLQVNDTGRTFGEFDLLMTQDDGQPEHWELAIKFFLATGNHQNPLNWYGPNPDDSLGSKYTRLVEHQLQLSRNPAAMALLNKMGISVATTLCFLKGRLFYPYTEFIAENFCFPDIVNPGHEKGWWLPLASLTTHLDDTRRYAILDKQYWLAPIQQDVKDQTITDLSTLLHLPEAQMATLVAVLDEQGTEISRGFIVKDAWLEKTEVNH